MKLDELQVETNYIKAVDNSLYQLLDATALNNAFLISYNKKMCDEIGLDYGECETKGFVDFINGKKVLDGSTPYSMVYAGHQFGYFVSQLGDGRAINIGSINKWHLQTKGSGLTSYSRQGDGRAVLRSSIREYIMSEAMHGLGIPTTRSLALIGSTHKVYREWEEEKGAVVMRASTSWIRIGSFEFFARTQNSEQNLKDLADYVIEQSYPHLIDEENKYEKMYFELVDKTAKLIALWQVYGFMHGVMNTDNMSMDGLTIDYGPFSFMDYFDKHCICNHTDVEGRYSYNNQPFIARWNLEVLSYAMQEIANRDNMNEYLNSFFAQHEKHYLELMNRRLGLDVNSSGNNNLDLILELLKALEESKVDYNCFFYELTNLKNLDDIRNITNISIYPEAIKEWFGKYKKVIESNSLSYEQRYKLMKEVNPKYIIKNYMLQEAIDLANDGDFSLVNDLLNIAQNPFDEHKKFERYSKSTPMQFSNIKLSCSS